MPKAEAIVPLTRIENFEEDQNFLAREKAETETSR